jgi:hypothetical protein
MQLKAWPFPLLALVLGLAGVLAGAGVSLLISNTYRSQATLRIESGQSRLSAVEQISRFNQAVLSRRSLARIINDLGLYRDEQRTKPLEDVIDDMRQAIRIDVASSRAHRGQLAFQIRFDYRDSVKARKTVAALISGFQDEAWSIAQSHAKSAEWPAPVIEVLDRPSPAEASKPKRLIASAMAHLGMRFVSNAYASQATLRLKDSRAGTSAPDDILLLQSAVIDRTNLAQIIQRVGLYPEKEREMPLEEVIAEMQRSIHIHFVSAPKQGAAVFNIGFACSDEVRAQRTVAALVEAFRIEASNLAALEAKSAATIEILDRASTPIHPVKPNRYKIAGLGGVCGVFLAGIVSLLRRRWKPEPRIAVNS